MYPDPARYDAPAPALTPGPHRPPEPRRIAFTPARARWLRCVGPRGPLLPIRVR